MIPDFEIFDSEKKKASALKKLLAADFKRRDHTEEQKAQQDKRFLKGRPIAYMICEYFKVSGTREPLLDDHDQLRVQLKNENVQGFDTKWDEVLLSMTKVPDADILEDLFKQLPE